jgi:rare lipoprotein A
VKSAKNSAKKGLVIAVTVMSSMLVSAQSHSGTQSAQPKTTHGAKKASKTSRPYEVGEASWYGKWFNGKPTASGEAYDMNELTAAHPTLPLGTWVKVTNLRNHLWVLVRVNDRGPVVPGRIIDLSYSAARMLNMSGRGIAKVRLDLVTVPDESSSMALLSSPY